MTTHPALPRISAPVAFAGLFALELRRLLRGWRWRAVVLLAAAAAFLMGRSVPSFGEGSTAFFPGAVVGIRALGLLFAAAGLVLAIDLAGEADARRARQALDARPFSGLLLQGVRLAAVAMSLVAPAALTCLLPPLLARLVEGGEASLFAPNVALFSFCFLPALFAPAAAGLAARALTRNDAAAATLGVVLLAPWYWFAFFAAGPERLFLSASRILGLLVPTDTLARDALVSLAPTGPLLAVAAFRARMRRPATALSALEPPRAARLPLSAILGAVRPRGRLGAASAFAAALFAVAGAPGCWRIVRLSFEAVALPPAGAVAPDWSGMLAPAGATNAIVDAPRILRRRVRVESFADRRIEIALTLAPSAAAAEQALAALTFGPACRVDSLERLDGGAVVREDAAASAGMHAAVLRFDPPLRAGETVPLRVVLSPSVRAGDGWTRLRHPTYATFQDMPLWYGAGMRIRYGASEFDILPEPAPFDLDLPAAAPRAWVAAGTALAESEGRARATSRGPASLQSLFAADVTTVSTPADAPMAVSFVVFPEHEDIARAMQTIYSARFERLARAFGPGRGPFAFVEVPSADPADPFAIGSGTFDLLASLLPEYDDRRNPTKDRFEEPFARMHLAIVEAVVLSARPSFEHPELLRDALVQYLHGIALGEGRTGRFAQMRRDYVYVPWEWQRPPGRYPFDLTPRDEGAFSGPALAAMRDPAAPAVPPLRLLAFHHMLRARLGDEAWRRTIRAVFGRTGGDELTLAEYRAAAEEACGEPLGEFFDQWLSEGVVPRYRLREADVVLAENAATRTLEYTTRVVVANEGTGRVRVPVVLEVEGDRVEKTVEPGAGEEATVVFATPERPVSVAVDPDGWIVQMPEFDARAARPVHPRLALKTVREL